MNNNNSFGYSMVNVGGGYLLDISGGAKSIKQCHFVSKPWKISFRETLWSLDRIRSGWTHFDIGGHSVLREKYQNNNAIIKIPEIIRKICSCDSVGDSDFKNAIIIINEECFWFLKIPLNVKICPITLDPL